LRSGNAVAVHEIGIEHDAVRLLRKIVANHRDADAPVPARVEHAAMVPAPWNGLTTEATERVGNGAQSPRDLERVAAKETTRWIRLVELLADDRAADRPLEPFEWLAKDAAHAGVRMEHQVPSD